MSLTAVLTLVSGLLIFAVSVPLIRRKVPRNPYYGFRVAAAFVSEERWYAINEYSGRLLAKWSILPVVTGIVGFFLPRRWFVEYSSAAAFLLVCTTAIPILRTFRWIRNTYGVQKTSVKDE